MGKKLKIAQVTPYYWPSIGGVEKVVQYVSEELVKRSHRVHVLTADRDHKVKTLNRPMVEDFNGVEVHRFKSFFSVGHMSFFPGSIRALTKGRYSIIHAHVYRHPHVELAAVIGRKMSIPVLLHGHGPFFKKKSTGWKKALLYDLYDWQASRGMLKRLDHIISLTEYERQQYVKLGVPADRISVVPNAADDVCFKPVDPASFVAKHNLGGRRVILYLSILSSYKRPDLLIQALPSLIKVIPNLLLLLVGPNAGIYDLIEKLGRELGVNEYYRWIGPLQGQEKHQAFEAAEFLLLPSDEEPFPLVVLEAMAHGRPVIGSDAVGPSEQIVNGETGFIIRRGSVEDIVEAALRLLTNTSLRNNLGNNARKIAEVRYTVARVLDQFEEIYYRILKR